MDEKYYREKMDEIMDFTKESLVDAFAEFVGLLNDRKLDQAALSAHTLSYGLSLFSRGLATEALARRMADDSLDKPE